MASVSSTFEFFIGSYDVDKILLLSPNLGSFYTISFDFLIGMVLINVLLAILVDSYVATLHKVGVANVLLMCCQRRHLAQGRCCQCVANVLLTSPPCTR